MTDLTDMKWLFEEFAGLEACCLHIPVWKPIEAEKILVCEQDSPDGYGSENQMIIVSLKTGGFGLLTSWADTTGHGCRCDSMTAREDTMIRLLGHLTPEELMSVIRQDRA